MDLRVRLVERTEDSIGGIANLKFEVESPTRGVLSVELPLDLARRVPDGYSGEAALTRERPPHDRDDLLMTLVIYQPGESYLHASAFGLLVSLDFETPVKELSGLSRGDEAYLLIKHMFTVD